MLITAGIVDDDKETVQVFAEYLEILDVKVVSVGYNGKAAVDLYKKYKPDILFLDLMMPEYDGIYGLENIRAVDSKANIVIITADLDMHTLEKLEQLRPTEIFFKPFDLVQIKTLVDKMSQTKNSCIMVSNEKKALISFTVTQALLKISPSATNDIGSRLYTKHGCYFSDCLEHPEYLRDILYETFGKGAEAIIKIIKESLAGIEQQQEISNFLNVLSR